MCTECKNLCSVPPFAPVLATRIMASLLCLAHEPFRQVSLLRSRLHTIGLCIRLVPTINACQTQLESLSQRTLLLLLTRGLLNHSRHVSMHFSKPWPVFCLQLPASQHQVVPVWAVIKTEYESSYEIRSYISVGHDSGFGILYPLITAAIIACAFMPVYGLVPLLNTSQHSTPYDHTSLLDVYLRS